MRLLFAIFCLCAVASAQFPPAVTPNYGPAPEGVVTYAKSDWTEYTQCTHVCGGGYQRRQRQCLHNGDRPVPMHYCQGPNYRRSNPLERLFQSFSGGFNTVTETQRTECNVRECRTSLWDDWTDCDRICGGGKQQSTRTCLEEGVGLVCRFKSIRERSCNNMDCFKLSGWGPYKDCDRVCGRGQSWRTRSCVPAFESYMPQYGQLAEFLEGMGNQGGLFGNLFGPLNPRAAPYFGSYMKNCNVRMRNWQYCNTNKCPACPPTQIYHTCMPCKRHCPKDASFVNNFISLNLFFPSYLLNLNEGNGCDNKCVEGCACPSGRYLGVDQRCYLLAFQCPRSHHYERPGERITSVSGNTFYSTVRPQYPTSTDSPDIADPRVVPYVPAKPSCPYGILLLGETSNNCICDGLLRTEECLRDGDEECPKRCLKNVQTVVPVEPVEPVEPVAPVAPTAQEPVSDRCPPYDAGKMDPGTNCSSGACTGDADCTSGKICCNTACGRACAFAQGYYGL